ncbi:RdgB/HAM1 family non-canonical purine NTP pyrophosphatase [Marinicella sp. W31]|uniref:RdgB/HAM1 family non-canonical purine NTP pyrophosphatase n=1 Tax=Marinicella sp. W31 TaxID=3023713 RepID=UPI003756CA04
MLATGNVGKLKELQHAFTDISIEIVAQPKDPQYDVEETGTTFVENAIIKARHGAQLSGLPTIADDSGIIVPALQGEPGIRSARYAGEPSNADRNIDLLLHRLRGIDQRTAYFYCALVYMRHAFDPAPLIAEAAWYGKIANIRSGDQGFGYDPVFHPVDSEQTAAELAPAVKQKICHRGQAVDKLKILLQQEINNTSCPN